MVRRCHTKGRHFVERTLRDLDGDHLPLLVRVFCVTLFPLLTVGFQHTLPPRVIYTIQNTYLTVFQYLYNERL